MEDEINNHQHSIAIHLTLATAVLVEELSVLIYEWGTYIIGSRKKMSLLCPRDLLRKISTNINKSYLSGSH